MPKEIRDVSFPRSILGYDRAAVDAYIRRVNRSLAELEVRSSPESAVRHALEKVGEQTGAILQRAREAAEEIIASGRREAEEIVARARAEADEIVTRARKDVENHLQNARQDAAALREAAEARVRELDADTVAISDERRRLLDDMRRIAARLEDTVSGATARLPLGAPAGDAEEESGAERETAVAPSDERSEAAPTVELDEHRGRRASR